MKDKDCWIVVSLVFIFSSCTSTIKTIYRNPPIQALNTAQNTLIVMDRNAAYPVHTLEQALTYYARNLPALDERVTEGMILEVFDGMILVFRKYTEGYIPFDGRKCTNAPDFIGCGGVALHWLAEVAWASNIYDTFLYHELHHLIGFYFDEISVDYAHADRGWWEAAIFLQMLCKEVSDEKRNR